ncbi:MAG: AAA family ATPase [Spirochaetales bacterium]|nr:AAA family ATPase [Spirochaetales bacterium]
MAVRIDANELKKILDVTPAEQNIMLTGKHGIGKSQILEKYYTAKGHKVVILFLGQMSDPGDLIGLPHEDEKTGKTAFMPPYWFPTDNQPVVLLLDELNRARPEVLHKIMDLALNRTLAGRKLPKGSRIISAVNDGEEYQLTDLDPALVSRFNVFEFRPTPEEWLLWAAQNGLNQHIINFISENPDMLYGAEFTREDQGLEKTPDRRGWERISNIMKEGVSGELLKKIAASVVGMGAASKFYESIAKLRLLTAKDILLGDFAKLKNTIKEYTTPDFAAVNESLFRFIEAQSYSQGDIPKVSANLEAYYELLFIENFREAMAHFANLYSSGNYPNAIVYIVEHCGKLYDKVMRFINSI